VPVPHQVPNQAAIIAAPLSPLAVADPCGLDDGRIIAHVIDQSDETVVQTFDQFTDPALVDQIEQRKRVIALGDFQP
jgi:hypothetical protein